MCESTCECCTFHFGKINSASFHPTDGPLGSSKHLLVPVEKLAEVCARSDEGRDGLLSHSCSDLGSPRGQSDGVKPECTFLLRPFLSDLFNVLWTAVSGLAMRYPQGAGARCVEVC